MVFDHHMEIELLKSLKPNMHLAAYLSGVALNISRKIPIGPPNFAKVTGPNLGPAGLKTFKGKRLFWT